MFYFIHISTINADIGKNAGRQKYQNCTIESLKAHSSRNYKMQYDFLKILKSVSISLIPPTSQFVE